MLTWTRTGLENGYRFPEQKVRIISKGLLLTRNGKTSISRTVGLDYFEMLILTITDLDFQNRRLVCFQDVNLDVNRYIFPEQKVNLKFTSMSVNFQRGCLG